MNNIFVYRLNKAHKFWEYDIKENIENCPTRIVHVKAIVNIKGEFSGKEQPKPLCIYLIQGGVFF